MGNTAKDIGSFIVNPIAGSVNAADRVKDEAVAAMTPDIPTAPRSPKPPEAATQADAAAAQQRRRNNAGVSRSDTILTGPLGLQGQAPIARKTLLGE